MRRGLDILYEALLADPLAVARVLVRAADLGDRVRQQIAEALRDALAAEPSVRATASRVQDHIATAGSEAGVGQNALMLTGVRARQGRTAPAAHDRAQWWQRFNRAVTEWSDSEECASLVTQAANGLRRLVEDAPPDGRLDGLTMGPLRMRCSKLWKTPTPKRPCSSKWLWMAPPSATPYWLLVSAI